MFKRKEEGKVINITPPNFQEAVFTVEGTAPYVQLRFSEKQKDKIKKIHENGSKKSAIGKKTKEPRNFKSDYESAKYIASDGKPGIPARQFKAALVSACTLVGVPMTTAKKTLSVIGHAFDKYDGDQLIEINGKPEMHIGPARNANGSMDLRSRPMWKKWSAKVHISFDADFLKLEHVSNLLMRAGVQIGIGEGRPFSRQSCGMGWGTFIVKGKPE